MYTREKSGKHQVFTPEGQARLQVHMVGPHPILMHFLSKMSFSRIVNSCLATSRKGILDHARTLSVLIQNIILSPAPLYRISEWAEPVEHSVLGLTETEKKSLNDDRIARSLDALTSARARSLFFNLALHIIKQFELDTRRIHHDSTTVTFHGQYKGSAMEPHITYGMNKDHRPDLKQLVFGLNVTADGAVPVSHEIYSGNRTDDTIHCSNIERLREILGHNDFIYVADSKMCTRKNLRYIADYGGKFVTVLPRSRAEDRLFRRELRNGKQVRWRKILKINNSDQTLYSSTSDGPSESNDGYRIIWFRSSQKKELDAHARIEAVKKAEAGLLRLDSKINRGKGRKRSDIMNEINKILKKYKCERFINVKVGSRYRIQTKHLKRGRPVKGAAVREIRRKEYYLRFKRDKDALRAEEKTDGVFSLLTNLHGRQASKESILTTYKYQPYVEKRHSLFKTELGVAPVYLKKPNRAAGLIHATFLAMILDALIERTLRLNMNKHEIDSLPILPEGRSTKTPTTARILEVFSGLSWYEFTRSGETVSFPLELSSLQKKLLCLLDMDISVYS
jgi:transposase